MMEKGIECEKLFSSQIFQYTFDYDEWPSNHNNATECIRGYNGSIFRLRANYATVFPEAHFEPMREVHDHCKEDEDSKEANQVNEMKVYKIKFEINLLASIGMYKVEDLENRGNYIFKNKEVSLMALASESEEMTIFNTESFDILIAYKW